MQVAVTTARLPKTHSQNACERPSRAWTTTNAQARFFSEPYQHSFDKGKPVEKRGRKAKDLKLRYVAVMTAWLPKAIYIHWIF